MTAKQKRKTVAAVLFITLFFSSCITGYAVSATPSTEPSATQSAAASPTMGSQDSAATSASYTSSASVKQSASAEPSPFFSDDTILTKNNILLKTAEDLQKIGQDGEHPLDGSYALSADIDGKNADFAPIANFSGSINGNGHKIMNWNIHGSGLFEVLSGSVSALNLENITVMGEKTAGILAGTIMGEAKIEDVFIMGKITAEENGVIGGIAGTIDGTAAFTRVQVYVDIQSESKTAGAFAGIALKSDKQSVFADCLWSNAYGQDTVFGLDSEITYAEGITKLATDPTYLAIMTNKIGKLTTAAPNEKHGLAFKKFELSQDSILTMTAKDNTAVFTAGEQTGAQDVYAVYEKVFADKSTAEVRFINPVIVSKDINETKPLEPVDSIFPTQIEEVKPLEPIDAVFPMQLNANEATVTLTNWEQFKNIGNIDYNKAYTMSANYVLAGDITADSEPFTPIGTEQNPFTGTFDGAGYSIDVNASPTINQEAEYYGLFGVVKAK